MDLNIDVIIPIKNQLIYQPMSCYISNYKDIDLENIEYSPEVEKILYNEFNLIGKTKSRFASL